MRYKLTIFLLLFFIAFSCDKNETAPQVQDGELVEACVSFNIISEPGAFISNNETTFSAAGGLTKDINDPSTITNVKDVVKNLWIIQYDGVGDDAKLLGEPVYIADFELFYNMSPTDHKIKLVATGAPCAIYFIANTFQTADKFAIAQGSTIADLKSRTYNITTDKSTLVEDLDTYHAIFNGCYMNNSGIGEGSTIEVQLKRNIAKAQITVKNSTSGSQAITIKSVQMRSVPSICNYLTYYDGVVAPFPAEDLFNAINYEPVSWPDGESSISFTSYIPVNLRGEAISNTAQESKNKFAPDKATHLVVEASYKNENNEEVPIEYTFFLGANLTDNFNIEPNKSYVYEFDIKEKGNADSDSRIQDWGVVDYSDSRYPVSNSYILNPISSTAGVSTMRSFRIPIQQIKTFWGTETVSDYENDATLSLRDNAPWKAFVLASDFEITDENFKITKASGNSDDDRYFEVAVAPGISGNVIVAVGPNESNDISWSWHLWITDYNPYESINWGDGIEGQYIYPVKNGALHRYEGTWWNNNKDAYMMDRNLGYLSVYEYPSDNRGLLYYQSGRKDPFFFKTGSQDIYKYPDNPVQQYKNVKFSQADAGTGQGVLYSIANPLHYICGYNDNWTVGNKYNPQPYDASIIWNDPNTGLGKKREGKKSIFDPCPPGYRVPNKDSWRDFRSHHVQDRTTNAFSTNDYFVDDLITESVYGGGFSPYYKVKGLQYWPFIGADVLIPSEVVYIPGTGYKDPAGNLLHHGNRSTYNPQGHTINGDNEIWSFLWADETVDMSHCYGYTSQPNHLNQKASIVRARALPVRCVTYRE